MILSSNNNNNTYELSVMNNQPLMSTALLIAYR